MLHWYWASVTTSDRDAWLNVLHGVSNELQLDGFGVVISAVAFFQASFVDVLISKQFALVANYLAG